MSLQARLDRIKEGFVKQAPPEVLAIMNRVAEDLRDSGIADSAAGEGQQSPDFTLDDSLGRATALAEMRSKGPVVLTFYRGDW